MDKKLSFFLENANFKKEIKKTREKAKALNKRWSSKETDLFYEALKVCGLEFTLINQIFTGRTRKQIKNKYLKEEKINKDIIEEILKSRKSFDREMFEKLKLKQ